MNDIRRSVIRYPVTNTSLSRRLVKYVRENTVKSKYTSFITPNSTEKDMQYSLTHSLTHSLLRLTSEGRIATSTTSDPAPMTKASRLCTRDPLPPVVSRSSLAGQVDASSRGQGICLREVDTVLEDVLAMSVFCQLWWYAIQTVWGVIT